MEPLHANFAQRPMNLSQPQMHTSSEFSDLFVNGQKIQLQPQIPVSNQLDSKYYINMTTPNPFTVKPIETEWKTNELIMTDPQLRVVARVAPLDIGHKQSSNFISPQHINPGYKWCGGYPNCGSQ